MPTPLPTRPIQPTTPEVATPPYTLASPGFPFPALTFRVHQAPLGGQREVLLACLICARLANGMLAPYNIATDRLAERSTAALAWLTSLELDPAVSAACQAVLRATGSAESDDDGTPAIRAGNLLRELKRLADGNLDTRAASELELLIDRLLDA